jgi:hypothetical protein
VEARLVSASHLSPSSHTLPPPHLIATALTTTKQQPATAKTTLVTYSHSVLPTMHLMMPTYSKDNNNNNIIPQQQFYSSYLHNHNNKPQSIDTNLYLTTNVQPNNIPPPLVFRHWLDYLVVFNAQNRDLSAQLRPILLLLQSVKS